MPRGKSNSAVTVLVQSSDKRKKRWESLVFGSVPEFKEWCGEHKADNLKKTAVDENGFYWVTLADGRNATAMIGRPVVFVTGRAPITPEVK